MPPETDDKKLGGVLKKMALTNLNGVEEVNIFKKDGNVIHISTPKSNTFNKYSIVFDQFSEIQCLLFTVQASIPSNTYVISGSTETKKIEELLPGILSQCGEESMDYLRAYAESSGATKQYAQAVDNSIPEEDDDEDMPELVENFEEAAGK